MTGLYPAARANDNAPRVLGSAVAGTTVRVYGNSSCTGPALASGSAAAFASPGIPVAVADNTTTTFYATASEGGAASACSTSSVTFVEDSTVPPLACADGRDNDGDARTDFPADQGCDSPADQSEAPDPPQCADRLDNDGDGRANFPADQGCESAADTSEAPDPPQCSDRLDNDGDGLSNFPADPDCEGPGDDIEAVVPPDTVIVGRPSGTTWNRTPAFRFLSYTPGASFRCRIDSSAWAPCSSPYNTTRLAVYGHSFEVAAVSPEGVVDPTPARREFTVGATVTYAYRCRVHPFESTSKGFNGCTIEAAGQACGHLYATCSAVIPRCPLGALCTFKTSLTWRTPTVKDWSGSWPGGSNSFSRPKPTSQELRPWPQSTARPTTIPARTRTRARLL